MAKRNIIVVGASGRLGSALHTLAKRRGARVVAIDVLRREKDIVSLDEFKRTLRGETYRDDFSSRPTEIYFCQRTRGKATRRHKCREPAATRIFENDVLQSAEILNFMIHKNILSAGSSVVFITSTNAITVSQQSLSYHLSRAAIPSAVRWYAARLVAKDIAVCGVGFGLLGHPLNGKAPKLLKSPEMASHKIILAHIKKSLLLKQSVMSYVEAAKFCQVIASKDCRGLTGQTVYPDRGYQLLDPYSQAAQFYSRVRR